jgi:PIN domain nuclease of toxin-antitoxin system
VILDTCTLLWLVQGKGELSEVALQRIDAAPVVYISAISGFEIGIKVQRGKLALPARPADWFAAVLAHHNLEVLPLHLDVCLRSTALPAIHADPCDRMILAAAQVHHMPVVTTDPIFAQYEVEIIS